jgi:hypothetical protein
MGVVPAEGTPPPMLAEGKVRLMLPDGSVFETRGRVIRASGENEFLLQADSLPPLESLRRMTKVSNSGATQLPISGTAASVPSSSSLVDDLLLTVSPENLLFRDGAEPSGTDKLQPEPAVEPVRPLFPTQRQTHTAKPLAAIREESSGSVSIFDLLNESVEIDKFAIEAGPVEEASAPRVVPAADTSVPRRPMIRMPVARAGTPGSVKDLPERRADGTSTVAGGGSTVTGRETEYSDVYAKVRDLPLLEKQKLARHGRRTVRQILMRDPNKSLQRTVLSNPDVMLDEVLEYANWPGLAKDALEAISANSTWMSSRMVILALVKNPSSPLDLAIRLVPRLGPSEWRLLARPNFVRMGVSTAARKALESIRD